MKLTRVSSIVPALLLAACVSPTGEQSSSSQEAMIQPHPPVGGGITNAAAVASAGSITVTFDRDSTTMAASVHVVGPDGRVIAAPEAVASGAAQVTHVTALGGLDACTHYQWQVLQGVNVQTSGQVNTPRADGGACPSSESFAGDSFMDFRGVHHERHDHSWCTSDSWNQGLRIYPTGTDWITHSITGSTASWMPLVGYDHFNDPGSDPFPCGEELVDAYRARATFTVPPPQARRATHLSFSATFSSFGKNGPRYDACIGETSFVTRVAYPYPADSGNLNDYGAAFRDVLGGFTYNALERSTDTTTHPLTVTGNQLRADLGAIDPAQAATGAVSAVVGLAAPNDGFASQTLPASYQSWAADNDKCVTQLSNLALQVDYAPLAPSDPACTATAGCSVYDVTCVDQSAIFTLHRVDAGGDTIVTSSAGHELSDSIGSYASASRYYVCASSSAGTACHDVPAANTVTCGGGGGGAGGGGGGGGTGGRGGGCGRGGCTKQ